MLGVHLLSQGACLLLLFRCLCLSLFLLAGWLSLRGRSSCLSFRSLPFPVHRKFPFERRARKDFVGVDAKKIPMTNVLLFPFIPSKATTTKLA